MTIVPPVRSTSPVVGLCPVLETPFNDEGVVDEVGFLALIDHLLARKVGSVMFPGFASEYHKLTDVERSRLVGLLLKRTRNEAMHVIISVADHATYIAVARALDAVRGGADAISILPPHFLGPAPAAVRAHVGAVLTAIAPTPAILQYAPAQTGTAFDAESISALAAIYPNLRQVKVESAPPGALIAALRQQHPPLTAAVGYAGVQLPDALRRGAVGVQPGCSFVKLYLKMWSDWTAGRHEDAVALHTEMLPYLSYWMQNVELIIAAEKLISQRRGLIDSAHCRAPAHTLDVGEVEMVDRFLDKFASLLAAPSG